jgi:hypothetical protein
VSEHTVLVNRAPVLTLWAAIVAERQGHDRDAALTLGKAVAGLNAQAKGRALGIYQAPEGSAGQEPLRSARPAQPDGQHWVSILGRMVPAKETPGGMRAVIDDRPISPEGVESYLQRSFGASLDEVRAAMEEVATSYSPEELETTAYGLYERFRPQIAPGKRGWGQKGELDLGLVRSLARH